MNMVITTGCSHSGWERVLPILQRSGLELTGDSETRWIDECFQAVGAGDSLQIRQPLQPESGLGGCVTALFSKNASSPVLLADSRNLWLLDFWAKQFPQAQFLLFFTRVETALAHALQQEVEPRLFLECWQAANRQLLKFHWRHRQRSLLLDVEAVSLHPQALKEICRRIGLVLKPTVNSSTPAIVVSAVERLLAEYLLATQPAVQTLQMELEASSQPLGDMVPNIQLQPAELIDSFRQSQAYQRTLQQQLEQAQQTLQKQEKLAAWLQIQIEQLTQARDEQIQLVQQRDLQLANITRAHDAHARVSGERLAHIEQLTQACDEQIQLVQQRDLQLANITRAHDEHARVSGERLAHIEVLTKDHDEQVRLANERQSQLEQTKAEQETTHRETAQENELLLQQLLQGQEELEHYFLKCQELTDERHRELQAKDGETDKPRQREKVTQMLSWNRAAQSIARLFKYTNKERKKILKQVDLLKASGLFDEAWYLSAYPDVASAGIDPVKHYLSHGVAEGRNPSPVFDTRAYLAAYPDIVAAGVNPLVHFVEFGRAEGRQLH